MAQDYKPATDWKEALRLRIQEAEGKAEKRRDKTEEDIFKIIGDLPPIAFLTLRTLFEEWEEASADMEKFTERLTNLY
jgi:hypothetical protein